MAERPVTLTLYRWPGAWGPFKVKIPCGQCSLSPGGLAPAAAG